MIDKLRAIAIFSTVVDQGTFRAAALHLGLAPSRVSETISDLEKDLGVTLLYRSTRQLSLTQEGRILHEKAQKMLSTVESGLDAISSNSQDPHGALRVTAPAFMTQTEVMDDFASFARAYPKVDLRIDFSDAPRDLIRDGFDVAIRAGWLEDSDLMARNIGRSDRLLVANQECLDSHGVPSEPGDLESWNWIRFSVRPNQTALTDREGRETTVTGRSHISVNSADALYEFARRGLGVAAIPEKLACLGFARGELIHILPEWSLKSLGYHAVWPDHSRRENLTTLFVRHLAKDSG
ncbi:MAG: LysR family transcriptional regulator [Pseudomonadota bacterium]